MNEIIEYEPCTEQQLKKYEGEFEGVGVLALERMKYFKANCIKSLENVRFMGNS